MYKKLSQSFNLFMVVLILLWISFSCQSTRSNETKSYYSDFQLLLDKEVTDSMPGILVNITAPDYGVNWSGGSGYAVMETKTPIHPDQVFRIASVTKSYVAVAILRLWEDGKLSLDDPISKFIAPEHSALLRNDGYQIDSIKIRHVLTHSSGLFDHGFSKSYVPSVLGNPTHEWTRTEQIEVMVTDGEPVGPIGKQFYYSDTGYVLLGEIIENIMKSSLNDGISQLINFKKLGINNTYFEKYPEHLTDKRIHQYFNGRDTYLFHPSLDLYGGGGILTNCSELSLFYQSLFNHKIFLKEHTLDTMIAPLTFDKKPWLDYRMGIFKSEVNGLEVYSHSGFWGTQVAYFPKLNTTISANYSSGWKGGHDAPIIEKMITVLINNED
jgi:D-alanyl-D-alanine carboxypeptidase